MSSTYKFVLFAAATLLFICPSINSKKLNETCTQQGDCDWGLQCGDECIANKNDPPLCIKLTPFHPYDKVKGRLPYNRYSWLTTRRSYARTGVTSPKGSIISAPPSQENSITEQLQLGTRGLMLDMFDYNNDIWFCFFICSDVSAFQRAVDALNEVREFLETNTNETIAIFIEDHVRTPNGLTRLFEDAGLKKLWFPARQMLKGGGNWPTIDDMINRNQRLLVFTSKPEKEKSEGIAYKWNYIVENQYGDSGIQDGSCSTRVAVSSPLNSTSKSLVAMNFFPNISNMSQSCMDNSASLLNMVTSCYAAAGNRAPNFIVIDFHKRNEHGEVAEAIDKANGLNVCEKESIADCKVMQ